MAALIEELVEEVLLRLPPGDPASLVRAALVCKRWCRLVADRRFRRRFREFHRAPPMLGFLCNLTDDDGGGNEVARFVPTSSFRPPAADRRGWVALDARHGRVLLCRSPGSDLVVWDPITDERRELPALPLGDPYIWKAAVLCAAHGACDHLDCHHGPFLVVFVDVITEQIILYVYSSETGAWSEPTHGPDFLEYFPNMMPTALVGNALYFVLEETSGVLKYDLATGDSSFIEISGGYANFAVLMRMEDGELKYASVEESSLLLWGMEEVDPEGDDGWLRVIQHEVMLPDDAFQMSSYFLGLVHGIGLFYVATRDGLFTMDSKSNQVRKVCSDSPIDSVVPYMSFYTPDFSQYGFVPF